jgi:DNA-binding transcriptional LysR family regulator
MATHAAIMGQGIALGWAPLVDELLATGQLVELFDTPVVTGRGYLLVTQRAATPAVGAFRQWFLGECGLDAE